MLAHWARRGLLLALGLLLAGVVGCSKYPPCHDDGEVYGGGQVAMSLTSNSGESVTVLIPGINTVEVQEAYDQDLGLTPCLQTDEPRGWLADRDNGSQRLYSCASVRGTFLEGVAGGAEPVTDLDIRIEIERDDDDISVPRCKGGSLDIGLHVENQVTAASSLITLDGEWVTLAEDSRASGSVVVEGEALEWDLAIATVEIQWSLDPTQTADLCVIDPLDVGPY